MSNHDIVVKTIFEICKGYPKDKGRYYYNKVHADHIGEKFNSIVITSTPAKGQKAETYSYNPDVYAEIEKTNKYDVFVVWDNEPEGDCFKDLILFVLIKNKNYLSIVCLNEKHYELAKKLDKIILNSIHVDDGNYGTNIILLPDELLKDNKKLKAFLKKNHKSLY